MLSYIHAACYVKMECCYCGENFIYTKTKRKSGYNRKSVKCQLKKNTSLSLRYFLTEEGIDVNSNAYVLWNVSN